MSKFEEGKENNQNEQRHCQLSSDKIREKSSW
jgi:hypothetical protein